MKTKLLALLMISSLALTACAFDDDDNTPKSQRSLKENDKKDENKKDENKKDENKKDENKKDENKKDENKKDENKKDENKQDDTKPDTPFTMEQQKATYSYTMDSAGEPTSIATTPKYAKGNDGLNFKQIQINGKTFTLPENSGNGTNFAGEHRYYIQRDTTDTWDYTIAPTQGANGVAYARYGWYRGENPAEVTFFYQGNATPDMPTTGTNVTYKGYAMATDMAQNAQAIQNKQEPNAFYYGQSTFNVDFANKKMTGTLNDWKVKDGNNAAKNKVDIAADIKANTFKGTANTGTAEGKFYGPKAQNLAGAFNDKSQNLQGVFGANKQ